MLSIPERLLLLTLNDKGKVKMSSSTGIRYGLAGAILMELALLEKVEVDKNRVILIDDQLTGDPVLDGALANMKEIKKTKKAKFWVNKLAKKKYQDLVFRSLVEKDIVENVEEKILGIFPTKRYPIKDIETQNHLEQDLRAFILKEEVPEERTLLLVGLLNTCKITNHIFAKDERKEARRQIEKIMKSDLISKSVSDAVKSVEAATIAAMGAAAASSVSS
ncbi:hypothetical protein CEY16_13270 [Halalkalibacillus sediminis]|uniref:GPP34 family phosphoprotein n=1 Tax=Halalkalibacillus sediminis TaxID=2018042 RepID=A0A2I0QR21_9BACI|nr:GPP34 family phosphoprotein [Halalkalibacillus sediminis]PKR76784.1 hypothetical protein CEY16_13270 [Halalkalibacillus sediminis]